jgi:hypothetical protein
MKKIVIALGLVALILAAGTYVYAQGAGHGRMGWGYGMWSSLTHEHRGRFQKGDQTPGDENTQWMGPGWRMGAVYGGGPMMEAGYGRGRGYGLGSANGTCY